MVTKIVLIATKIIKIVLLEKRGVQVNWLICEKKERCLQFHLKFIDFQIYSNETSTSCPLDKNYICSKNRDVLIIIIDKK